MFIVIVIISLRTKKVNDSVYTLGCECCTICITSLFSSKKRESLSPVRKWLVPDMVDLLIIAYLTSRRKHVIHIHEENNFNNIIITTQKWRRNGKTRATTWLPLEMHRELHRSEQMLPSVAATMRILFVCRLLQRSLTYMKRSNILLAMIYGHISRIITW